MWSSYAIQRTEERPREREREVWCFFFGCVATSTYSTSQLVKISFLVYLFGQFRLFAVLKNCRAQSVRKHTICAKQNAAIPFACGIHLHSLTVDIFMQQRLFSQDTEHCTQIALSLSGCMLNDSQTRTLAVRKTHMNSHIETKKKKVERFGRRRTDRA